MKKCGLESEAVINDSILRLVQLIIHEKHAKTTKQKREKRDKDSQMEKSGKEGEGRMKEREDRKKE